MEVRAGNFGNSGGFYHAVRFEWLRFLPASEATR